MVGCLEVSRGSYRKCRFAISSECVAPGGILLFRGGVGEVMSTDKVLLGGKDLDLERQVILGMCTNIFLHGEPMHTTKLDSEFNWSR